MAGAHDPGRPLRGLAVLGALTLIGVVGLALVLVGLGGTLGPAPTATQAAARSPAASAHASPVASPSLPAGSPRPVPSADASMPPTDDPLLLGLLTDADLPGLVSPLGPQDGTDYDIDGNAFGANGGIRVVSRVWQSLADTGLAAVFDFRMQFPTEAAAAAFLADADPVLSDADATGHSPVPYPPAIGSDSRVYGLVTRGDDGTVLLRTYLFRVGPVVAKLVAGGPGVDAATTDALARAAAARILTAGPPAPGSPRPSAAATPVPTATPPLPTGDALAALLLDHVPPEIGQSCVPDAQRLWPGELATLACTADTGDVTVTYSGFDTPDSAEAAFDGSLGSIDLRQLAGSCDQGPYLGPYEVEGEEVGRVACWAEQGGQAIMWWDGRLAILAVAASPTLDAAGLYLWWQGAGPVP
jgi:hypothetical protein